MINKEQSGVSCVTALQALEALHKFGDFLHYEDSEKLRAYKVLNEFIEDAARKEEAFNYIVQSAEECEDADGWLAFVISADDYHKAIDMFEGKALNEPR